MKADYEYIYTIYREGSFTRAAEKLFITQPALSIALRKIEARIGMPLFIRNRRPIQLTPAGVLYLKAIRKMQHLEKDLDREVQQLKDLQTGSLTIGGSHYILSYKIPDLLTAFAETYPRKQPPSALSDPVQGSRLHSPCQTDAFPAGHRIPSGRAWTGRHLCQ